MQNKFDVIVIGGGASGLMAVGRAAERGLKCLILEKNPALAEKLKISGGGRCNITNAEFDNRILLANFGDAEDFLYSPFSQFSVEDAFRFFESRGLPLKVEVRKRAFPKSEKAFDVFTVLKNYIDQGGVEILLNSPVTKVNFEEGKVKSVQSGTREFSADNFIFATGGLSHPETGSTGDGFDWLRESGHRVEDPVPTIVPLKVREKWPKSLSGTSLRDIKLTFYLNGRKNFSVKGEVLFTHFGLSGPTILNCSGKVNDLLLEGVVTAKIDCFPEMDLGSLDDYILRMFDENKNKDFKNVFRLIAPLGTHEVLMGLFQGVDPELKVHSVTVDLRKQIVRLLKDLTITISGLLGFDKAVIADGGVALSDVDTKTMRSKRVSNLFIIGDLLNVRRPSGGFSLQLCWTTGWVAGAAVGG